MEAGMEARMEARMEAGMEAGMQARTVFLPPPSPAKSDNIHLFNQA
jgi:hypothetical protein